MFILTSLFWTLLFLRIIFLLLPPSQCFLLSPPSFLPPPSLSLPSPTNQDPFKTSLSLPSPATNQDPFKTSLSPATNQDPFDPLSPSPFPPLLTRTHSKPPSPFPPQLLTRTHSKPPSPQLLTRTHSIPSLPLPSLPY